MTGSMPLRTDLFGIMSLLEHFPSLVSVSFTSWALSLWKSDNDSCHVDIERRIWCDYVVRGGDRTPPLDHSFLPGHWTVQEGITLHIYMNPFVYGIFDPHLEDSVWLSSRVTWIVWDEANMKDVQALLKARRSAGQDSLKGLEIILDSPMTPDHLTAIANHTGDHLETLTISSRYYGNFLLPLRSVLEHEEWGRFRCLRNLTLPVALAPRPCRNVVTLGRLPSWGFYRSEDRIAPTTSWSGRPRI
jgi:hypothetical protein